MIEQKVRDCIKEQERLASSLGNTGRQQETLLDTLRTVLEETDIRISELKKG